MNVGNQKRDNVLVPRKEWLAKLKAIKAGVQAAGVGTVIIITHNAEDLAVRWILDRGRT